MIAFASLFLGLIVGVQPVASQRIVWVRGRHLPQEITFSEKAAGLDFAR